MRNTPNTRRAETRERARRVRQLRPVPDEDPDLDEDEVWIAVQEF